MDPRTALIIGGTSGVGLATARQLHRLGVTVHVAGRSQERLDAVAAMTAISSAIGSTPVTAPLSAPSLPPSHRSTTSS